MRIRTSSKKSAQFRDRHISHTSRLGGSYNTEEHRIALPVRNGVSGHRRYTIRFHPRPIPSRTGTLVEDSPRRTRRLLPRIRCRWKRVCDTRADWAPEDPTLLSRYRTRPRPSTRPRPFGGRRTPPPACPHAPRSIWRLGPPSLGPLPFCRYKTVFVYRPPAPAPTRLRTGCSFVKRGPGR